MNHIAIQILVTATIFSLMFSIGINHSLGEIAAVWRKPGWMLRALLVVVILVPLVVGLLVWFLDLPASAAAGLILLAAAPGAPLLIKRSQMAGADPAVSAGLQLTLVLLAVAITPLCLSVFYAIFDLPIERIAPLKVLRQAFTVTFLPVSIGLVLHHFAPKFAKAIQKPVLKVANVLFLILLLLLVLLLVFVPDMRSLLNIGGASIAAILIMVAVSLALGHLLGGPSREQRASLAIAGVARNVGLALFIAEFSDYGHNFVPIVISYMILGSLVAVPYSAWSKRQITKSKDFEKKEKGNEPG